MLEFLSRPGPALTFANLVDFDSEYGHRNDPEGYARCVEVFDRRLPEVFDALAGAAFFLTGDHGCDPTTPSTDHSRELTPLLGARFTGDAVDLQMRSSFADLGATVGDLLGLPTSSGAGTSFAGELQVPTP